MFSLSPLQSDQLKATGIAPPPPVLFSDLANRESLQQLHFQAAAYSHRLHSIDSAASAKDRLAARVHCTATEIALNLDPLRETMVAVAAADVARVLEDRFQRIENRIALLSAQTEMLMARLSNRDSLNRDDEITSFRALPVIPPQGQPMVEPGPMPAVFPLTREHLNDLSLDDCNVLLSYYGIQAAHEETEIVRRRLLAAFFALPHWNT